MITIGDAPAPQGLKAHNVAFVSPAAGAVQVAKLFTKLVGRPPAVIVVPLAAPANQTMAYAGLAAESATPILYAESAGIAPQTIAEIQSLGHVPIYVAASSYLSSSPARISHAWGRSRTSASAARGKPERSFDRRRPLQRRHVRLGDPQSRPRAAVRPLSRAHWMAPRPRCCPRPASTRRCSRSNRPRRSPRR